MTTGENREHKFTLRKHEVRHLVEYIICAQMPEMVFTASHGSSHCTQLFPVHTKCQHIQNYLLAMGRYYLYICQQVLHTF